MENHKEIKKARTIWYLLCLLPLSLSSNIHAASTLDVHTSLGTIPDTCLHNAPARSVVSAGTSSVPPLDDKPLFPYKPIDIDPDPVRPNPIEPVEPMPSDYTQDPNAGLPVGTPKGAIYVGNSGAATYNIEIGVPYGGTLTPQIGLSYNSQLSGYGLAGYGFNITGISAITRGGHDLLHDGKQAGVTYTASDNLFIDGKRLILQSGISGQNGAVYTVEGDPFTRVVVHGNYNDNATTTWFEVSTNSL